MHINYVLNLGISKKSYTGSGSFELAGSAIVNLDLSYIGSGSFELAGSGQALQKFLYTASGSFEIVGTNNPTIPAKVFKDIKFNINQVGTTYDNKQYTVYQIQGTGKNPQYVANNTLQSDLFNNNNLFTDSEIASILANKNSNEITKYENIISYINNKLSTAPLPIDNEVLTNIKFNLKQTFVNILNQNKQVISVLGLEKNPEYVSDSQIADGANALTSPENTEYTINKNNNLIVVYEDKLDVINNKLAGMIPPTIVPVKTNTKFYIKQDGFNDLNQAVNIQSVIGITSQISYDSNEGVYKEDQLLDDSEAASYFSQKYDNLLDKYNAKLAEINGRLNA